VQLSPAGVDRVVELSGYSHIALPVADLGAARSFYCDLLGCSFAGTDMLPECNRHIVVAAASGQLLALCAAPTNAALANTGIHYALRVTPRAREEILARLSQRSVVVHRYKEDRLAEGEDNVYFFDPFGNRLQLVAQSDKLSPSGAPLIGGIDHVAMQAIDVEWGEKFYVAHLGLPIDYVVGWRTADYVRARLWGDGKEEMAPGARRWDKRYNVMHGKDPVPRPNAQLYVKTGDGVLCVYLADTHFQEPPEEAVVGVPRLAFAIRREDVDRLAEHLADWGPIVGPVKHPPSSLRSVSIYCKDPGSNFLEFCC
jgi:catechol 2,3-dioxygenase-like lactoylglutathione lyase family enzyme